MQTACINSITSKSNGGIMKPLKFLLLLIGIGALAMKLSSCLRFGAVSKMRFAVQAYRREGVDGAFQRITPVQLLERGTKNPDSLYVQ
jgi:hypothetical protein